MSSAPDTLWYTRTPNPTPLGLASQLGWFHDEFRGDGIKIFTLEETTDPALRCSRTNHHLAHSFRQGGNVTAIWARAQGTPTRVLGLNWLDEYQGIITLPRSGIRSPRDLRNRRIGLPLYSKRIESRRSEALHGFLVALELGGLRSDEVEFIDIALEEPGASLDDPQWLNSQAEYRQLALALQQGSVDAIYLKGDQGLQLTQRLQARVVLDISRHPDPLVRIHNGTPRPITVHQTMLDRYPDITARFLARIVAIEQWAADHPAETLAYIGRETRGGESWIRQAYGADLHLRQQTELSETSINALKVQKAFLLKWGFIQNDFNVDEWIDHGPLRQARQLSRDILATAC